MVCVIIQKILTNLFQVNATPRPHITVSGTLSARICPNPSTNVTGVACNNSVNNPHIVSYTNSIPQTQNLTTSTAGGMNRVAVNNISISRTIQVKTRELSVICCYYIILL